MASDRSIGTARRETWQRDNACFDDTEPYEEGPIDPGPPNPACHDAERDDTPRSDLGFDNPSGEP